MKIILISIIFFTNLFSDSLVNTNNKNYTNLCVKDAIDTFTNPDPNSINFFMLVPNEYITFRKVDVIEIKTGYKYNSSTKLCELITTNPTPDENGLIMGMKETDFNLSMAFWGICLSFLMSIGLIISF
jgi:hypothetical protein